MAFIFWVKIFLYLLKMDVLSVPNLTKIGFASFKLMVRETIYKKVYQESNIFFIILFLPLLFIDRAITKIKALRRGLTLPQFLEEEVNKITAETELLKIQNSQKLAENMNCFASIFPGATIHHFNDFVEITNKKFLSIIFLRNSLWQLILGGK